MNKALSAAGEQEDEEETPEDRTNRIMEARKLRIRSLDMVAATRRARAVMDQSDTGRIAALLDDFNAVAWPH